MIDNSNSNINNFSNNNHLYNNIYSENHTGENSNLLFEKDVKKENEEKKKIILRCENSEDFFVSKNKKKIRLKKKETLVNKYTNPNYTSDKNINDKNMFKSDINSQKYLFDENITEEHNTSKDINYFNIDNILEVEGIKFK